MNDEDDVEKVKEILQVVSEKIPALLNQLTDVLYGKESAAKYGQAVAGFYKALKESGMDDKQAYELTKTYMSSLDFMSLLGKAVGGHDKGGIDENVGDEIRKRIKIKLEEKNGNE